MTEKASAPERLPFSCGLKYFTKASLLFYGDAVFVFTIDFFIADTHFCLGSIIRYENRPFLSVGETDTVYVPGDFCVYSDEENKKISDELKGTKILILENHDMHFACVQWRKSGFDEVLKKI